MPKKQPSMAEKKKKKAQKQKQKQKQIVKTNVKVNVQSSGGSGGGGAPSFIPQMFRDTSGENQRIISLVEQIASRVPRLSVASEAPVYNPANDPSTVNAVFNAPIDLNVPEELGGVKKSGRPKGSKNRPRPIAYVVGSETENDPTTVDAVFNASMNSNVPSELKAAGQSNEERAKRKLLSEERAAAKMVKKYGGRVEFEEQEAIGSGIPSQFMSTEY